MSAAVDARSVLRRKGRSNMDKARAAWGDMPDWVAALAAACDAGGLNRTAEKISLSPALVSLVIRRTHHAGYEYAEARVRNTLMTPLRPCPVLGLIDAARCAEEQARPFTSVNPLAVAVYRTCRSGCRYFTGEKKHAA